ncbi:MAG TPA: hypothetical protein VEY51_13805, partial [Chondromyces sp.]|nr:hypothetical protein [Chondromyces sp.]
MDLCNEILHNSDDDDDINDDDYNISDEEEEDNSIDSNSEESSEENLEVADISSDTINIHHNGNILFYNFFKINNE